MNAMKRFFILLAAVSLMTTTLSAQIAPGMKYRDLKRIYNPRYYVKSSVDPYSKFWAGAASFVIPGLGQVICGETGRGVAVFGGYAALSLTNSIVSNKFLSYAEKDSNGNYVKGKNGWFVYTDEKAAKTWGYVLLGSVTASLVYDIWNICDAPRYELYNLDDDPGEENDLAALLPDKVEALRTLMRKAHVPNPDFPVLPGE